MDDYISREAVLAEIDKQFDDSPIEDTNAWMIGRRVVRKFPAANVRPEARGKWIPHSKIEPPVYHCSVCGGAALYAFGRQCKSDCCPNCGADMRPEPPKEVNDG